MSSITIATLPRMTRDALSELLLSTSSPSKLAIIDVRDQDHIGGHIYSSTWVPSSTLDYRMPELVRTLKDKEKVVFHCALSQQRGPSAALRYAREREAALGPEESKKQQVYVLEGGFVQWQEKYGKDTRLTEADPMRHAPLSIDLQTSQGRTRVRFTAAGASELQFNVKPRWTDAGYGGF
ncbi:hypothetical protein CNMCM6936_004933 [Aspergillus lentulus]|nr:hypothetical protein CNMCM6936_004933 [Aspergillus lentulus]